DLAVAQLEQAGGEAEEGGLARPVVADEGHHLAGGDLERQRREGHEVGIGLGGVDGPEGGFGHEVGSFWVAVAASIDCRHQAAMTNTTITGTASGWAPASAPSPRSTALRANSTGVAPRAARPGGQAVRNRSRMPWASGGTRDHAPSTLACPPSTLTSAPLRPP